MKDILKALKDKISEDYEREQYAITCHDAMARVIAEKWVGKKVNKRICDQFKVALAPDPAMQEKVVTYLKYIGSMCNLEVWGFGPFKTFDQRIDLFLGYDNPIYSGDGNPRTTRSFNHLTVEGFEENDNRNGNAAKERQKDRQALLSDPDTLRTIAEQIQAINTAKAKLGKLCEYGTPAQQVRYTADNLIEK